MPSRQTPQTPSKICNGKFEVEKRLGAGCFGEVYRGVNKEDHTHVAIKFEDIGARTNQLEQEASVLKHLNDQSGKSAPGFTSCFYFGREGNYYALVMELLGKSLEHYVQTCGGKFKVDTTVLCAVQLIRRTEYLHSKCLVHRDIKPENFMFGSKDRCHQVFMIDFGLSKRYWDNGHYPIRDKLNLTGTARYASINAHRGLEQSRRDDLEAIGHMLLYFLRGSLPWSGLEARTKEEKYRKIRQKKETVPLSELCAGFPKEFLTYLGYCRDLQYKERPDYERLLKLFGDLRANIADHQLEWLEGYEHVDKLQPIAAWRQPLQPDDVAAEKSKGGKFCLCFGKAPKED